METVQREYRKKFPDILKKYLELRTSRYFFRISGLRRYPSWRDVMTCITFMLIYGLALSLWTIIVVLAAGRYVRLSHATTGGLVLLSYLVVLLPRMFPEC